MRTERATPRAHLVVDDFFAPAALKTIFAEIATLDLKPGLVRDIGHDGQSIFFENPRRQNQAVWIHDPSKTLRLFRERLWAPDLTDWFEAAREPLFQIIPNCGSPNLQVSRYMTGDHYDFHEDEGAGVNLTAIVFLAANPEKVHGGDLTLVYDDEKTTVRFRHNRLVIFPSKTLHRVTRVRVDSTNPRDGRISLQSWLTYGRAKEEAKAEAIADKPTFLLSEAPIIAAAQLLLANPESPEHSAEELYWGAFYLSRVLTQNLRWLALESGLSPGDVRIVRVADEWGGEALEVYVLTGDLRMGFSLQSSAVEPHEAVSLFVEAASGMKRALVPAGAAGEEVLALVQSLLSRKQPRARRR